MLLCPQKILGNAVHKGLESRVQQMEKQTDKKRTQKKHIEIWADIGMNWLGHGILRAQHVGCRIESHFVFIFLP